MENRTSEDHNREPLFSKRTSPNYSGVKVDRDEFVRFVRSSFPLRFTDRVYRSLPQKRVASSERSGLHGAVGPHDGFDLDGSRNIHGPRQGRIVWSDPGHHLALALGLILLSRHG